MSIESNNFDYVENHNLSQLMNEWLFVFKKIQVTPRTFENNLTKFKKYIEIKKQLEGKKGILYLDSGNYFEIKE